MAAETIEVSSFGHPSNNFAGRAPGQDVFRASSTTDKAALGEASDIVKFFLYLRGRLPTKIKFWCEQLDSHATAPTLQLTGRFTDDTTTVTVFEKSDVGWTGGVIEADIDTYDDWYCKDIFDTVDWRFEITVATAAATAASGAYAVEIETQNQ